MDTDGQGGFSGLLRALRADAGLSLCGTAGDPSMPSSQTLVRPVGRAAVWGCRPQRFAH